MKKKIILIGGGGHCKACIDVIECTEEYEVDGILDVNNLVGKRVLGYPIIGTEDNIKELVADKKNFLITVGHVKSNEIRKKIYHKLVSANAILAKVISPRSYVSKHSIIHDGTIIMHDSIVNANVSIGKNCIINTKSIIEHDVTIKDHCHISTGAIINGGAIINSDCFIGSNATTQESINLNQNSFIKAGTVVKK